MDGKSEFKQASDLILFTLFFKILWLLHRGAKLEAGNPNRKIGQMSRQRKGGWLGVGWYW
jgi:hypothetical protein